MIPKIVHQIWISSPIPDKYRSWSRSFTQKLPDWEHRIWDDAQCLELVSERFPQYLDTYTSLASPVAKVDVLRYMILFEHGGMYADMDCECKRPFDFIGDEDELLVCTEVETKSSRVMNMYPTDLSPQYCQWTFLSRPGHPALAAVLESIHRNIDVKHHDNPILDFVKRTGPHAFTNALTAFMEQGGQVKFLPGSYFGCFDTRNTLRFMMSVFFPELGRKVYVRHHFTGSWMDEKVKRKMLLRNLLLMPEPLPKSNSK